MIVAIGSLTVPAYPIPRPALKGWGRSASAFVRVNLQRQATNYWCWAAVSLAVAQAYGKNGTTSQCDVAEASLPSTQRGSCWEVCARRMPLCTHGPEYPCNKPEALEQVFGLGLLDLVPAGGVCKVEPASAVDFVAELKAPRLVAILTTGGPNHFRIVHGFETSKALGVVLHTIEPGSLSEQPVLLDYIDSFAEAAYLSKGVGQRR